MYTSQTLFSAVESWRRELCNDFCFRRLEGKVVHHGRCIHGDEEGVDACESSFAGCRNGMRMGWDGMGWDGCYDWMRKAVRTIVVLIVNAFNAAAAGVRVEEEDHWWWYWGWWSS